MTLTKQQIKQASKIAVKNSKEKIKGLGGMRLGDYERFCNAVLFLPNLSSEKHKQFIKEVKK